MRRTSTLQPFAELVSQRRAITSLMAQNRYHIRIQRFIQRRLPGFLAEHCRACVARDDTLIVFTDSPAWATQLRFTLPGLLGELRSAFHSDWQRTQIRVLRSGDAVSEARHPAVPGISIIRQVQAAASSSPSLELRDSLLRLAATWQKHSAKRRQS